MRTNPPSSILTPAPNPLAQPKNSLWGRIKENFHQATLAEQNSSSTWEKIKKEFRKNRSEQSDLPPSHTERGAHALYMQSVASFGSPDTSPNPSHQTRHHLHLDEFPKSVEP